MHNPAEIEKLLDILRDSNASVMQKQTALLILIKEEKSIKKYLLQIFISNDINYPFHQKETSYNIILTKLGLLENPNELFIQEQKGHKRFYYYAAASIAALLILIAVFIRPEKRLPASKTRQIAIRETHKDWQTVSNFSNQVRFVRLPDSSKVWLYANSTIKMKSDFPKENKILYLDGYAEFSVRKSIDKPFTVITKGVKVTDMGTIFSVKKGHNGISVHLYKGKVSVQPNTSAKRPVFLSPGQTLLIDTLSFTYSWQKPEFGKTDSLLSQKENVLKETSNLNNITITRDVVYQNMPLDSVLQNLNTTVGYNIINTTKMPLGKVYFTGRFEKGATVLSLVDILSNRCQFSYKIHKGKIIILSK